MSYMSERVAVRDDPKTLGKPLSGPMGQYWRYRVGNYRLICNIESDQMHVLVVRIGSRDKVYRENTQ